MNEPDKSIETHIALIYERLDQLVKITDARGADHEQRLRRLEQFRWVLVGIALASGPIFQSISRAL